jgi:DNA-binding SARP family transcriptional activator
MTSLLLLGRPMLLADGRPRPLAIRKSWALLTLLACGGALTRPRVVALLWPALDETSARRNLRRELARLAEAGAAQLVQADADYLALAAGVDVDLRRFEAACDGRRTDEALACWRGPLADGLDLADAPPFDDWLAAERERLHARRRRLLEEAAEREPPAQAIERLKLLLADDPLQERHQRALIRLLLADGRREDALAQYERCRRLLADELGLEPMAETQALLADVRRAEPAPRALALQLPEVLPFVGREAEVQALEAAWQRGGWLLVEGEGGVGKTRLALDFCAAHGATALARCQAADRDVPYAAFARALRTLAGSAPADLPEWVNAELARLLPELGPAPQRPLDSAEERARFFEACASAWRTLADDNFDAVVIDDLQHADAPSQSLLAYIAQRGGPARLLLLTRPAPLPAALSEGAALHLQLGPLADGPVFELVRELSGAAQPQRFAARLQGATGGNPFFIAETLRHLAESGALRADPQGRWSTAFDAETQDYRELPLPASVRDAVLARVKRLPDAPRRLLEAASLAAEPFAPELLAAACALSELEATAAIEQAIAAALLREHARGGFGFAHDLAQQALEAALPPARRRLVHRRLALAAEATRADPALTARHFEAAGEAARAVPFRSVAGDAALKLFATPEALAHWEQALANGPNAGQRAQLLTRCARAHLDLADNPRFEAKLAALEALLADGSLVDEARAEATIAHAELLCGSNRAAAALPRIDALPAGTLATGPRHRALRARSVALNSLGRLDEAQAAADAALASADDPVERAGLLDSLARIAYQRGRPLDALAIVREMAAIWAVRGDRRAQQKVHYRLGLLLMVSGQVDDGERELETARAMASEMHLVEAEREAICNLMKIYADRGDGARMLAVAEEGWALSPTFAQPRLRQILLQGRLHANTQIGNLGEALRLAEQVLAEAEASQEPVARQYAVLALLDLTAYLGDIARGRAMLESLKRLPTQQLAYLGVKLAFNGAFLEYMAGDIAAAQAALAAAGDPAAMQQPQDRATWTLRQAELLLAEDDAEGALALLEPWRGEMPNVELVALVWTYLLTAQSRLCRVDPEDWRRAKAALDTGTLPALAALDLQRALARSAPDAATAAALESAVQAAQQRLAESLAAWPLHRAGLLARAAAR